MTRDKVFYLLLEQYTVLPIAIYSFVPPGCRRGSQLESWAGCDAVLAAGLAQPAIVRARC